MKTIRLIPDFKDGSICNGGKEAKKSTYHIIVNADNTKNFDKRVTEEKENWRIFLLFLCLSTIETTEYTMC